MLIICPTCATSYDVDVASLRPNGRKVRCLRCRTVWMAELSHADKLIAAAEALAPVRRAVEAVAEATAADAAPEQAQTPSRPVYDPAQAWFEGPDDNASRDAAEAESDGAAGSTEVDSPSIVPERLDQAPFAHDDARAPPIEDIETSAARRASKRAASPWRWPLSGLQSGVLALILIDAIIIGWRADMVRLMPQTASFYAWVGMPVNLRGLAFENLSTATEQHDGVPILVVQGDIINETRKMIDVPRLRFAVRNAARQEIYSWTAVLPRTLLSPGEAVPFRTRLASPPPDAHDVLVRFLNRNDLLSGSR